MLFLPYPKSITIFTFWFAKPLKCVKFVRNGAMGWNGAVLVPKAFVQRIFCEYVLKLGCPYLPKNKRMVRDEV